MQPSIRRIIFNDYLAALLALVGPISLILAAFIELTGFIPNRRNGGRPAADTDGATWLIIASVVTVVALFLLWRRVSRIKRILIDGVRTTAKITDIGFWKDRGRVEFQYSHEGRTYDAGTALMKTKYTTALAKDEVIEIVLDPIKPSKAYIVRLYCA